MSFDIFVTAFRKGDVISFERALLMEAFGKFASPAVGSGWDLRFPDGPSLAHLSIDNDAEGEMITGFTVNRPATTPLFWQAIFDILRQTPTVLYWPGDGCVAGQPNMEAELPDEWPEECGVPTVVTEPMQILEIIQSS